MGSVLDRDPPPPEVRLHYGPGDLAFGELRLPTGRGPHPVVATFHGGYWRAAHDLTYMGHLCAQLADRGIATWNVEYRRIGQAGGGWPGTFLDVSAATDALRYLAPQHNLALDGVLALGHSAGGHLALWTAARARLPTGTPVTPSNPLALRGVVALAPVADLELAYEWDLSNGAAAELLAGSPRTVPRRYTLASPAALLPIGVPQVLFHGTQDEAVPYEMSVRYRDAARQARDAVHLITFEGDHFDPVDPDSPVCSGVVDAVIALLRAP